jgi:hypothetical protein
VAPFNVDTPMINNEETYRMLSGGEPTREALARVLAGWTESGIPWITPYDVTRAYLFLAGDETGSINGEVLHVSAGFGAANTA